MVKLKAVCRPQDSLTPGEDLGLVIRTRRKISEGSFARSVWLYHKKREAVLVATEMS